LIGHKIFLFKADQIILKNDEWSEVLARAPNEAVEKVTFLKTASSAGSKIGNYVLSSKVFTILGVMFLFS